MSQHDHIEAVPTQHSTKCLSILCIGAPTRMASFGVGAMLITMLTIFGVYFKFAWQGKSEMDVDKPGTPGLSP